MAHNFDRSPSIHKKNGISKGRQISVYDNGDASNPMLTVNIYHNGTVMVQGSENCLDNFQKKFQSMKEEAKKKENGILILPETDNLSKTDDLIIYSNPSSSLSPASTLIFQQSKDSQRSVSFREVFHGALRENSY